MSGHGQSDELAPLYTLLEKYHGSELTKFLFLDYVIGISSEQAKHVISDKQIWSYFRCS
jgi:hypothetical protein